MSSEPLRLRGGGGYDKEMEIRCRTAAYALHQGQPSATSEKIADLILYMYGEEKSERWVRRWWVRDSPITKKGQGAPLKFTKQEKKTLVRACSGFKHARDGTPLRRSSIREAARDFNRRTEGKDISFKQVAIMLKEAGLKYAHLGVKSLMREMHITARKSLYDEVEQISDEDLDCIVFTDSTKFELQRHTNKRNQGGWVKDVKDVPCDTTVKHPQWFHVYGGVSKYGVVGPYFVPSGVSITGLLYSTTILPQMIRDLKKLFGKEKFILQQDGAGAHFAHASVKLLEDENVSFWAKGFWPGNSADLSPIENMWSVMKDWVFLKGTPRNVHVGRVRVSAFFRQFTVGESLKLVRSFASRMKLLPENDFDVLKK